MLLTVLLLTAIDVFTNSKTCAQLQDTCQSFSSPEGDGDDDTAQNRLYVVPTMNFSSCGVINSWVVVGWGRGGGGVRYRSVQLHLLRPNKTQSPDDATQFFSIVSSVSTGKSIYRNMNTITFTSLGVTFSPGDVLGFYHSGDRLAVRYTSTDSILERVAGTPSMDLVSFSNTVLQFPLMSVSVSCMECPTSTSELLEISTAVDIATGTINTPITSPALPTEMAADDNVILIGAIVGPLVFITVSAIVLSIVISSIVCFRRKKVKYPMNSQLLSTIANPSAYSDSKGVHSDISLVNGVNESDTKETRWGDEVSPSPSTDGEGYMEPLCSKSLYQNNTATIASPYEEPLASKSRQKQVPNSNTREVNHYHQLLPEARHPSPLLPWHTGAPLNSEMQPLYGNVSAKDYLNGDSITDPIYEMSFCKEEVYCEPSTDEDGIYAQIMKWGYHEIPRFGITLSEKLGEGQFGEVYKAEMRTVRGTNLEVAVKLVKKGSPPEERTKLLQEAATLGQFKHRHVVRLIGVVTLDEPKMMIMELLPGGNLRDHLLSIRSDRSELSSPDLPKLLLQFCKQVVDGLACLARKSFVHRDIAARNILLDKELNCKISDFGMTRDLEDDTYYVIGKGRPIPVRWTAPEALMYKKCSTSSDVWSYGMLMYEIWSVGHKPFEDKTVQEAVNLITGKYCLPPPPGCPRAVYKAMVKCWNPSHTERPSASDIGGEFCKSERILLSWKKEDIASPSSQVLGGPLSDREGLYKELQIIYQ